ncbi:MAG: hypothetical protein WCQ95_02905 [Bacteroidota bacterium]
MASTQFRASAQFILGGETSATFINGINIDLAPVVGYKFNKLSAGLSPVVLYTASSSALSTGIAGEFSYGGRVFVEYDIWKGILAHAEFEMLNTGYLNNSGIKLRNWTMGAPIGVGYEYEIAQNVWFKGMVLYDALLQINLNQSSPKANPTVRGGITYVF